MSWLDDLLGKTILRNSVVLPDRKKLNFIEGTHAALTVADNPGTGATDVTINLLNGAVGGPGTSTDNAIARWNGTDGALLQDSAITVDDTTGTLRIGTAGVTAESTASGGVGITGTATTGTLSVGVKGVSTATTGTGVKGIAPATGEGVDGAATSATAVGVKAENTAGVALQISPVTTAPALAGVRWAGANATPTGPNVVGDLHMSTTGILYVCTTAGSPGSWTRVGNENQISDGVANVRLSTAVGSNNLSIFLKTNFNNGDPSPDNPVIVCTRTGTTGTSGDYETLKATAATSIVVPAGATLGTANGVASYLWVYAYNNGNVIGLAVCGHSQVDEGSVQNTIAIDATADSAGVLYSSSGATNVSARLIGRILISEATAGNWASNATEIALITCSRSISDLVATRTNDNAAASRPGEVSGPITRVKSAATALTSPNTLNVCATPSIVLTPGDWEISAALVFVPAATTSITVLSGGVSLTTGTLPGTDREGVPSGGEYRVQLTQVASVPTGDIVVPIPRYRVSTATSLTLFLVAAATFSVSTMAVGGWLEARRVR